MTRQVRWTGAQALALSTSRRLVALDVLRGLAILGTLLTYTWLFSSSSISSLTALVVAAVPATSPQA
ncbi:hypothetical protein AS25_13270 [Kocuria marina]|uniref:Uncharacterized protein n=1 Tax=Kocuria marina TaxID=223184 RepID=A0A0B0DDI6_9MICC|nr:hypothetical protein [Kocuria marina]KHE73354.1 hypothetical protein AS25_13270 [Kocuria marina]